MDAAQRAECNRLADVVDELARERAGLALVALVFEDCAGGHHVTALRTAAELASTLRELLARMSVDEAR